jgi:hypothetical protein
MIIYLYKLMAMKENIRTCLFSRIKNPLGSSQLVMFFAAWLPILKIKHKIGRAYYDLNRAVTAKIKLNIGSSSSPKYRHIAD